MKLQAESRRDKTHVVKIVYYGPPLSGKTANLEALHRLTAAEYRQQLVSVRNADERTLLFDLLPIQIGSLQLQLFTVPGQVRYETTRQMVLSGADAIVFVADSTSQRAEQNRWSLQNLRMNMRKGGLETRDVPVIYQINKRDLPETSTVDDVRRGLGLGEEQGLAASAAEGRGVRETLLAVIDALAQLRQNAPRSSGIEHAAQTLREIISTPPTPVEPTTDADAPDAPDAPTPQSIDVKAATDAADLDDEPEAATPTASEPRSTIVVRHNDVLRDAIEASLELANHLSAEAAEKHSAVGVTEAFRGLIEVQQAIGTQTDVKQAIDRVLGAAADGLELDGVAWVLDNGDGGVQIGRALGLVEDPLVQSFDGRDWIRKVLGAAGAGKPEPTPQIAPAGLVPCLSAALVPLGDHAGLLAYAGSWDAQRLRFLSCVARALHSVMHQGQTGDASAERPTVTRPQATPAIAENADFAVLHQAYADLHHRGLVQDQLVAKIAGEMRQQLDQANDPRSDFGASMFAASTLEALAPLVERLEQVAEGSGATELNYTSGTIQPLLQQVVAASAAPSRVRLAGTNHRLTVDPERVGMALSQVIDNALRYSNGPIEVKTRRKTLMAPVDGVQKTAGVLISVLDRGPGVGQEWRDSLFSGVRLHGAELNPALGLHQARTIALLHRGSLDYRPRRGGGSEFRLWLPAKPVQPVAAEPPNFAKVQRG